MGLIKAAKEAISGTLSDQWKEAIRCDNMTNDMLMVRKTTPNGVISNGSTIIVAPGQCAIIYDNGKVIDATAEDGLYTFDESSTPSFFAGQFKDTFKEMWERFLYDGATSKQQAVFFFNLKEIMDNKFGTATPIPFQDWSHPIPNRMTNTMSPLSVKVRCYGTYTFKLDNPAVFMQELAGTADVYYKSSVEGQIRSEVMAAFQNVLNELGNSEHKIPVLEMPSQTDEMKQMLEERVYDEPVRRRGIKIVSFAVESVSLEEESEKKINEYELGSNSYMQQGRMTTAYANAVENAAQNANGAANGFMGIGMMNMATGGMMGGVATSPWQNINNGGNTVNYNPYENTNNNAANNAPSGTVNNVVTETPSTNNLNENAYSNVDNQNVNNNVVSNIPDEVVNNVVTETPSTSNLNENTYSSVDNQNVNNDVVSNTPSEVVNNEVVETPESTYSSIDNQNAELYGSVNNDVVNNTSSEVVNNEVTETPSTNNLNEGTYTSVDNQDANLYGNISNQNNVTENTIYDNLQTNGMQSGLENNYQNGNVGVTEPTATIPEQQGSAGQVKMCKKCGNMNPVDASICNVCGNIL